MMILILDDDPGRHEYFRRTLVDHVLIHVSTYQAAVLMLSSMGAFDEVYLDRDLNHWGSVSKDARGKELTGEDVVDFIVNELPRERWPKRVIVHSQNKRGAKRMFDALDDAGIYTVLDPFPYETVRHGGYYESSFRR
jgi:hypothetical protein